MAPAAAQKEVTMDFSLFQVDEHGTLTIRGASVLRILAVRCAGASPEQVALCFKLETSDVALAERAASVFSVLLHMRANTRAAMLKAKDIAAARKITLDEVFGMAELYWSYYEAVHTAFAED